MDPSWIEERILALEAEQFTSGPAVRETGASVAWIEDGRLKLTHARGLRNRESRIPVTTETVFPIASITKSFSAALLVQALHEQRVTLETPVQARLPEFGLMDPAVSREVSAIDLLAHRCGLPRHDALWYRARIDASLLLDRMKRLELNPGDGSGFRTSFQYNNLLYGVAGALFERLSGEFWCDAIESRLCAPIGMRRTTAFPSAGSVELALPYFRERRAHEFGEWNCAPAGAMHSTATDLALWLELQIQRGKTRDGRHLLDAAWFENQFWKSWNEASGTPESGGCFEKGDYGLGWFVDSFAGKRLIHHGGSISGFSLHASFMPEEKLGVVILVNQVQTRLPKLLASSLYSRALGLNDPPSEKFKPISLYSNATLQPIQAGEPELTDDDRASHSERPSATARRELHELLRGAYFHPGYGRLQVEDRVGGDLGELVVRYENAPPWNAVLVRPGELVAQVDWLGMPSRFRLRYEGDRFFVPFNLHAGCSPTEFKRRSR